MDSPQDSLENLPTRGPLGNQTSLWGCAPQESPITLGNTLTQSFPDLPLNFSLFTLKLRLSLPYFGLGLSVCSVVCLSVTVFQALSHLVAG